MKYRSMLNRACALLFTVLFLFSVAFGESADARTPEERLAAAREKYNANTVNVYVRGKGKYKAGKINACFYQSKNKKYWNIIIPESLQINDEDEMAAILEVVAAHEKYDEAYYGSISFMKAQWITHNIAHEMANGGEQAQMWVKAIAGEDLASIISRSKQLDITPIEGIPEREMKVYRLVEKMFSKKR